MENVEVKRARAWGRVKLLLGMLVLCVGFMAAKEYEIYTKPTAVAQVVYQYVGPVVKPQEPALKPVIRQENGVTKIDLTAAMDNFLAYTQKVKQNLEELVPPASALGNIIQVSQPESVTTEETASSSTNEAEPKAEQMPVEKAQPQAKVEEISVKIDDNGIEIRTPDGAGLSVTANGVETPQADDESAKATQENIQALENKFKNLEQAEQEAEDTGAVNLMQGLVQAPSGNN
jgi:hypothetical protein